MRGLLVRENLNERCAVRMMSSGRDLLVQRDRRKNNMSNVATMPPRVNGILETSLYVESAARSAEFYRRVFGFEPLEPGKPLNDETRLYPMRVGDRSVLFQFKRALRL